MQQNLIRVLQKGKFRPGRLATAIRTYYADAHQNISVPEHEFEYGRRIETETGKKRALSLQSTAALPPFSEANLESLYRIILSTAKEHPHDSISPPQNPATALPGINLGDIEGATFLNQAELSITEAEQENPNGIEMPVTVATLQEWSGCIQAAIMRKDDLSVARAFDLLNRTGMPNTSDIYQEALQLCARRANAKLAIDILNIAEQHGLQSSATVHHCVICAYTKARDPFAASKHLRKMEENNLVPQQESYIEVIKALLPISRSSAWNLFAHMRLVAHTTPNLQAYNLMLSACSTGQHPSPERAVDLYEEMQEHKIQPDIFTFTALIRTCSRTRRAGEESYYLRGIEFLRQMLDAGLTPDRSTLHAIMDGARRVGDLSRARWIFYKVAVSPWKESVDDVTAALLFQTYATFKVQPAPLLRERLREGRKLATDQALDKDIAVPLDNLPSPLPRTAEEVVQQVRALMASSLASKGLDTSLLFRDGNLQPSPVFESIKLTPLLLNSFLLAHQRGSHIFSKCLLLYEKLFKLASVPKNGYSYELIMQSCEKPNDRQLGLETARKCFAEWKTWAISRPVKEIQASEIWSSMIRNLARNDLSKEGVEEVTRFRQAFPPTQLVEFARNQKAITRLAPETQVQIADPVYPETSASWKPPLLTFKAIAPLHKCLADLGDLDGLKKVKRVLLAYRIADERRKHL